MSPDERAADGPGSAGTAAAGEGKVTRSAPGGLVVAPFRGLRYNVDLVGSLAPVTCPPYDVVDAATAARLAQHPYSVVRLVLPHTVEPDDPAPHAAAAARLAAWRRAGVLRVDPAPSCYLYEEIEAGRVHRGLFAALALPPAPAGVVLPHEQTKKATVTDRLGLLAATEADLEPILLVPQDVEDWFSVVAEAAHHPPLAAFRSEDGLDHRLWAVTDPRLLAAVSARLRPGRALLADGHHRYEASQRLRRQRAAGQRAGGASGPENWTLALLADPTTPPRVHAIHRVVPGLPPAVAAERAARAFAVEPLPSTEPERLLDRLHRARRTARAFVVADQRTAYLLLGPDRDTLAATLPPGAASAWRDLDVTIAHATLVRALWGVPDDPEHVEVRIAAADALQRAGQVGGSAILLHPPTLDAITAVAVAGERMPRKSTFFTPKPRTGLVLRGFADQAP